MCVLHDANIPLATTMLPPRRIDMVTLSLNIIIPIIECTGFWKSEKSQGANWDIIQIQLTDKLNVQNGRWCNHQNVRRSDCSIRSSDANS